MNVTSLGHAGLRIDAGNARLLCDPWLSPEGAFQASWFQYPDNAHLFSSQLSRPTAVVLTQGERDRADSWLLSRIASDVPTVTCGGTTAKVRRALGDGAPRRLIAAAAWQRIELAPDTTMFFVPEDSPLNRRAALVVQSEGQTIVDLSGSKLSSIQLGEIRDAIAKPIDLLCVQGASTTWYPACYEFSDDRRREAARQRRLARFAYIVRAIRILRPLHVMPFSAQPCFLDRDLFQHNAALEPDILPDQTQYLEWLADRGIPNGVMLMPGDSWDVGARRREPDPRWSEISFDDRDGYLEEYAERRAPYVAQVLARYPEPDESLWDAFEDYFDHLLTLSPYFNDKIGIRVGFHITGPGGGEWSVDFRDGQRGVHRTAEGSTYEYRVASRWARPLLAGELTWEDFLFSLRLGARRSPDLCNDHVRLLRYADEELLRRIERNESANRAEDTIAVHSGGNVYRIQRFCPHAKSDLFDCGEVLPGGIVRCLAHRYEYSLATGACLNGPGGRMRVERYGREQSSATPLLSMMERSS